VRIKPTILLIPLLLLTLLLGSCGPKETPAPTATPTIVPTITPTATPAVPLAILIVPADMDQTQSNLYQTTVYDLAQAAGYRFQVRNTLTAADLEPALKIVVILPPDPGLVALAASTIFGGQHPRRHTRRERQRDRKPVPPRPGRLPVWLHLGHDYQQHRR
jgi:hypothetical protein